MPIIAVILMLGTPKARSNGPAFAVGWVLGLIVVSVIVLLLAGDADDTDSGTSTAVDVIKLLIGVLFLLMAVKQWQARPKPGEEAEMPKWMGAIDRFTAGKSFGLGVAPVRRQPEEPRPDVRRRRVDRPGRAERWRERHRRRHLRDHRVAHGRRPGALLPVRPPSSARLLDEIKQFMSEHNAVIMFVLLLVLGAKLLGNGIAGLSD